MHLTKSGLKHWCLMGSEPFHPPTMLLPNMRNPNSSCPTKLLSNAPSSKTVLNPKSAVISKTYHFHAFVYILSSLWHFLKIRYHIIIHNRQSKNVKWTSWKVRRQFKSKPSHLLKNSTLGQADFLLLHYPSLIFLALLALNVLKIPDPTNLPDSLGFFQFWI